MLHINYNTISMKSQDQNYDPKSSQRQLGRAQPHCITILSDFSQQTRAENHLNQHSYHPFMPEQGSQVQQLAHQPNANQLTRSRQKIVQIAANAAISFKILRVMQNFRSKQDLFDEELANFLISQIERHQNPLNEDFKKRLIQMFGLNEEYQSFLPNVLSTTIITLINSQQETLLWVQSQQEIGKSASLIQIAYLTRQIGRYLCTANEFRTDSSVREELNQNKLIVWYWNHNLGSTEEKLKQQILIQAAQMTDIIPEDYQKRSLKQTLQSIMQSFENGMLHKIIIDNISSETYFHAGQDDRVFLIHSFSKIVQILKNSMNQVILVPNMKAQSHSKKEVARHKIEFVRLQEKIEDCDWKKYSFSKLWASVSQNLSIEWSCEQIVGLKNIFNQQMNFFIENCQATCSSSKIKQFISLKIEEQISNDLWRYSTKEIQTFVRQILMEFSRYVQKKKKKLLKKKSIHDSQASNFISQDGSALGKYTAYLIKVCTFEGSYLKVKIIAPQVKVLKFKIFKSVLFPSFCPQRTDFIVNLEYVLYQAHQNPDKTILGLPAKADRAWTQTNAAFDFVLVKYIGDIYYITTVDATTGQINHKIRKTCDFYREVSYLIPQWRKAMKFRHILICKKYHRVQNSFDRIMSHQRLEALRIVKILLGRLSTLGFSKTIDNEENRIELKGWQNSWREEERR